MQQNLETLKVNFEDLVEQEKPIEIQSRQMQQDQLTDPMQPPDKDIQTERSQNSTKGMVKHPSKVFKQNELEMSTKQLQVMKKPTGYDSES